MDHRRDDTGESRSEGAPSFGVSRDDLTDGAQARLDTAYTERLRRQCSRDDFDAGYIQALLDWGVVAAFGVGPGGGTTTDPIEVVRKSR